MKRTVDAVDNLIGNKIAPDSYAISSLYYGNSNKTTSYPENALQTGEIPLERYAFPEKKTTNSWWANINTII